MCKHSGKLCCAVTRFIVSLIIFYSFTENTWKMSESDLNNTGILAFRTIGLTIFTIETAISAISIFNIINHGVYTTNRVRRSSPASCMVALFWWLAVLGNLVFDHRKYKHGDNLNGKILVNGEKIQVEDHQQLRREAIMIVLLIIAITIANLKASLDGLLVMDSVRSARITLGEFSRVVDGLDFVDPDLEEIARKLTDDRPPSYEEVVGASGDSRTESV